jgi:hypothetical protein
MISKVIGVSILFLSMCWVGLAVANDFSVVFKNQESSEKKLTLAELKTKLKPVGVSVFDPNEKAILPIRRSKRGCRQFR